MKILFSYLKQYRGLVLLALLLAAINQIFSLLDPIVLRHIIDNFVSKPKSYTSEEFIIGVGKLLLLGMGFAMVSRIAKNFQDYFINVITQRLGAQVYTEGLEHSLLLPYSVFEDQRSGETLGKLRQVRTDIEKLIQNAISFVFTVLIGVIFVTVYLTTISWFIAPVYFVMIPIIGTLSSFLSRKVKKVQKTIVAETNALAGSTTESLRNIELVKSLGLAFNRLIS